MLNHTQIQRERKLSYRLVIQYLSGPGCRPQTVLGGRPELAGRGRAAGGRHQAGLAGGALGAGGAGAAAAGRCGDQRPAGALPAAPLSARHGQVSWPGRH